MVYNVLMKLSYRSLAAARIITTDRATRPLAWLLAVAATSATFLSFAVGAYFVLTAGDDRMLILTNLPIPFITAVYAIVGALVASRHPRNPIGWIFLAVGWLNATGLVLGVYKAYGPALGAAGYVPALLQTLWVPAALLPTIFVFLLFPDGRLISRAWRIVSWSAAVGLAVNHVAIALHPGPVPQFGIETNPDGIVELAGVLDIVLQLTGLLLLFGIVGSIAAFVVRLRRSSGIERQQMKWLSYAISLVLLSFLVGSVTWSLWPGTLATQISDGLTNLAVLGIAVATGIAILRYRLWDIDVVINRTLVYGSLTASVIVLYVLIVAVAGTLIQTEGSLLVSLVATGLIAALFQPLRQRLQRAVNRFTYGERDEPFEALARLGRRLEGIFPSEMVYPTIVETVAHSLKLPYAAISVQRGEQYEIVESYGTLKHEPVAYPLTHQGDVVGQL